MKKWLFLIVLCLRFATQEACYEWIKEANHRIYGDGIVRVGCAFSRDGSFFAQIVPEIDAVLTAEERSRIEDIQPLPPE